MADTPAMWTSNVLTELRRRSRRAARDLAFHANGKPRGWVRRLLFRSNGRPWGFARAVVYQRNGQVRAAFAAWEAIQELRLQQRQQRLLAPETLALLQPPESVDAIARRLIHEASPGALADRDAVITWLGDEVGSSARPLFVAMTHDSPYDNVGGVQNCIRHEEEAFRASGADYLVAFPTQFLPCLAPVDSDPVLTVCLNGTLRGRCHTTVLVAAIGAVQQGGRSLQIILHQLLGHHVETMGALIEASGNDTCWLWLHDFFTICPSYTLRRNNTIFCGAPELTSNSCTLCVHGDARQKHQWRMQAFFGRYRVHVMAPSRSALELWRARSGLAAFSEHVEPHITLSWRPRERELEIDRAPPIRIAFLGAAMEHKGWPHFQRLAERFNGGHDFEFLTFGVQPGSPTIRHTLVGSETSGAQDMVQALKRERVDIVIHWPTTHETFSLTTYEALQSGAYVVTNKISGNVAATVEQVGRGVVLADDSELINLFETGAMSDLGHAARQDRARWSVSARSSELTLSVMRAVN